MRRSVAIMRNDLALLRLDPLLWVVLLAIPIVVMTCRKPAFKPLLQADGYAFANGSEQTVPGLAVTFGFFNVTFLGIGFFREHIWSTWDLLRTMPVRGHEILLGKIIPAFFVICLQQALLFVLGVVVFGFRSQGPAIAIFVVDASFVLWVMAFGFATLAYAKTFQQVLAVSNLGAIVCGGLGGGLTPISTLPDWTHTPAHYTPTWWAMRAFNKVILDGQGLEAVGRSVLVLLVAAAVLFVVGLARFSLNEPKGGTL
jgi:ABC-2 type transport system permease protein